jgi:hypothetical protein
MGPAPAKLRGQNPRHETPVSALIESIGWKSFLPLRTESKGITSRLGGRWPFLPLSLECKSKSFATLNLLWRPTHFKAFRVHRKQGVNDGPVWRRPQVPGRLGLVAPPPLFKLLTLSQGAAKTP